MSQRVYEISTTIFLLQGALLVPLILWSCYAWYRQMARWSALEKALGEDRRQHKRTLSRLRERLPHFKPMNCGGCGGALALETDRMTCTNCRTRTSLPEDYTATIAVRQRLRSLARAATREWMIARLLASWPARAFFFLWIFAQPAMFVILLIGAVEYPDSGIERLLAPMGETWATMLMGFSFAGFIMWMVVSIMLLNLSKDLRAGQRAFPALAASAPPIVTGGIAYGNCQSCGGGVRFDARAFAALCNYCGVENYRAAHTAHERADTEARHLDTGDSLFGAMEVIEDFTATFAVTMTILGVGFLLLALFSALGAD